MNKYDKEKRVGKIFIKLLGGIGFCLLFFIFMTLYQYKYDTCISEGNTPSVCRVIAGR